MDKKLPIFLTSNRSIYYVTAWLVFFIYVVNSPSVVISNIHVRNCSIWHHWRRVEKKCLKYMYWSESCKSSLTVTCKILLVIYICYKSSKLLNFWTFNLMSQSSVFYWKWFCKTLTFLEQEFLKQQLWCHFQSQPMRSWYWIWLSGKGKSKRKAAWEMWVALRKKVLSWCQPKRRMRTSWQWLRLFCMTEPVCDMWCVPRLLENNRSFCRA